MKVDNKTLEESAKEHVSYEIVMFYYAFNRLKSNRFENWLDKNAFIEAFVVHTRNLIDFLYPPNKRINGDILADHFVEQPSLYCENRPEMHELMELSKFRANKEVAHLTYDRVGKSLAEKNWDIIKIEKELRTIIKLFYDNLSEERKAWFPSLP